MGESKRKFDMKMVKPGDQIPIDLKNAEQKFCECGSIYFIPVMTIWTVSALLSPIGKELTAQVPAMICMNCKKPWEPKLEGGET